jgi:hypothetical protein
MTGAEFHKPPINLRQIVETYLSAAGDYEKALPLGAFVLSQLDTERLFSSLDEDYHISRFLKFTNGSGHAYSINGFPQTHIAIEKEIQSIL